MNKMNKKGFTLIEMLVVIAIIAILVSIVIPVVGDSTEKARESKDAANIRAAITEATAKGVSTGNNADSTAVSITQTGSWDHVKDISGKTPPTAAKGQTVTVKYTVSDGTISFTVGGEAAE